MPTNDELELFFSRYDKDRDGKLRFAEFCDAFTPIDRNYTLLLNQRTGSRRPAGSRPEHVFSPITLLDFKETWRTHFRVEMLAEEVRQRLSTNPIFNLKNAFEILDFGGRGEICKDDIQRLISQRGFFISDKEADSLMQKFDKGYNEGAFTQHQFITELVPKMVRQ